MSISPVMMGSILTATIATMPSLIFSVNAVCMSYLQTST
jgi:hypothetical protein